jgi:hypothetical protein
VSHVRDGPIARRYQISMRRVRVFQNKNHLQKIDIIWKSVGLASPVRCIFPNVPPRAGALNGNDTCALIPRYLPSR